MQPWCKYDSVHVFSIWPRCWPDLHVYIVLRCTLWVVSTSTTRVFPHMHRLRKTETWPTFGLSYGLFNCWHGNEWCIKLSIGLFEGVWLSWSFRCNCEKELKFLERYPWSDGILCLAWNEYLVRDLSISGHVSTLCFKKKFTLFVFTIFKSDFDQF